MDEDVNIAGLDKAVVLSVLFNNSKPIGLGFLSASKEPMTVKQAEKIVKDTQKQTGRLRFDYVDGRVIKVDITGDTFDPYGYDRDNGQGRAAQIIKDTWEGTQTVRPVQDYGAMIDDLLNRVGNTKSENGQIELGLDDELREALKAAKDKFNGPK